MLGDSRRRNVLTFVALLLATLLLASCASEETTPEETTPEETTPEETTPEETTPEETTPEETTPEETTPEETTPEETTRVTLRLDWFASPHQQPFMYASAQGYYQEAGLEVVILEGRGSLTTAQILSAGADTFGYLAGSTHALGRAEGMPNMMVANYLQVHPATLIYLCDEHDISEPADLAGKSLASTAGSTPLVDMLPAMLESHDMTVDDLEVVSLEPAARFPALLEGRVDMIDGFLFSTVGDAQLRAEEAGAGEVCTLSIPDFGINMLGYGIIANEDTINNRPEIVSAFLEATNRGWNDALDDPEAAIDATVDLFPEANPEFLRLGIQHLPGILHTENTEGQPLGFMAAEDWEQTLSILEEHTEFDGSLEPDDYYTNEFLPSEG